MLLLCLFLAVRGLVPVGFMPAPLASGMPYGFCHGDTRSALLLSALAQRTHAHHDGGHNHDALTAQTFTDNHCSFSAGAGPAATALANFQFFTADAVAPAPIPVSATARVSAYILPLTRAPPSFPFS